MENKDQSAFPLTTNAELDSEVRDGLSKREYFAGLAMQGLCSKGVPPDWKDRDIIQSWAEWVAKLSVEIADETLTQLKGG